MKTQKVNIKKFKCLEDFDAEINGQNILLLADNGRGKSSFMQFIRIALGDNTCIPVDATGSGTVIMDKNGKELTFNVKMEGGKASIKVEGEDIYIDNKKGAISSLVGPVDFNINEFVECSKTKAGQKKQVDKFKEFLPQEVRLDISKHEARVKMAYDEQTEINKEKNKAGKLIQAHPLSQVDVMDLRLLQPVDTKAISQELTEARKKNDEITGVETRINERAGKITNEKREIEELGQKIQERKDKITAYDADNKKANKWLKDNEVIITTTLEKKIEDAGEINNKYNSAQELIKLQTEFEALTNQSGELTAKIESSRQAISDAIKDMATPVDGLAFFDDYLTYNGIPVSTDSLSTSEIIELGVRLKMAENPDLGILFISDGQSIGTERLKLILDIAKKNDFQVLMEQIVRGKNKLTLEIIGA